MRRIRSVLGIAVASFCVLTACGEEKTATVDVTASLGRALRTGSGLLRDVSAGVRDTVEFTKQGIDQAKREAADLAERGRKAQEALRKLDEGRKQLQEALGGAGRSSSR